MLAIRFISRPLFPCVEACFHLKRLQIFRIGLSANHADGFEEFGTANAAFEGG
jgi:hypothetical protein